MSMEWRDWREANRSMWDERVPIHVGSRLYDVDGFLAGACALRPFELEDLPDVSGCSLVHLQCHFGLDTLSWARRGADVTGVDFSEPALEAARVLADRAGLEARFVLADVMEAASALGQRFDVVYTGLGALCWLPDIEAWADQVAALVVPGGTVYVAEFHPFTEVFGDDGLDVVRSYFHDAAPERWEGGGTYADPDAETSSNVSYEWTHPVSEVIGALLDRGLELVRFREHEYTLFPRWPFLEQVGPSEYRLPASMPSLPLMYSVRFRAPSGAAGADQRDGSAGATKAVTAVPPMPGGRG